jgi:inhibitor of cysteine peptidase
MNDGLRVDENANGAQVSLSVDQRLEVCLKENRTTGFRWTLEETGEPALVLLDDAFQADTSRVGAPGSHRWRFAAKRPGAATLKFRSARSWEEGQAPAGTYALRVSVVPSA